MCLYASVLLPVFFPKYLNTLGEMEGFISSHCCDVVVNVGELNVDFDHCCPHASLSDDFMSDHSLCLSDLSFQEDVMHTYECDDGAGCSWIDHVLCSPRQLPMIMLSIPVLFILTITHCSLFTYFFLVYFDGLLQKLFNSGVGCYWGNLFAGAVC